ncbi:Cytochrome c family protein [hydrothermal vent metagenome]|uniref:Cytochrome c family protein n=1 Tax=hydrothermal vent metagenome TaxID=652676 RepID=A0A1W1CEQ7_9ZZZZ
MKLEHLLISTLLMSSTMAADIHTAKHPLNIKQEGIGYIKMLGGALKTELKTHMKQDPTGVEALSFCTGSAENITKEVNSKLPAYAKVRRTALKVRNATTNRADATDKKVMQAYQDAIKEKTFTPKDIKVIEEGNVTRIYKPLITKNVCLKCHGDNLNPKLSEALKSAYPNDKAIGFKEGELRGVIVAEITKH